MARTYESLSKEEQVEIMARVRQRRIIEEIADIDYECYVHNITWIDFWLEHLKGGTENGTNKTR